MIGVRFWNQLNYEKESFIDIIRKIKNGDKVLKDKFISDYRPFILKSVSRISGKYIDTENSEEYSIGLMAFNEAIESYDMSQKCAFKNFSEQVIKRRLIDYERSNKKNKNVYPFTFFENKDNNDFEERYLMADTPDPVYNFEIREELARFQRRLEEFGIPLQDLFSSVPKHIDTRQTCVKVARFIAADEELYDKVNTKKTLPFKELMKFVDVSQRTLERQRKYIIALILILNSDMDILKRYMRNLESK